MNLPEDVVKEICKRMNSYSLYNFIQSSHQNYKLSIKIFNLKYYEDVEYPQLMKFYIIKNSIRATISGLNEYQVVALYRERENITPNTISYPLKQYGGL